MSPECRFSCNALTWDWHYSRVPRYLNHGMNSETWKSGMKMYNVPLSKTNCACVRVCARVSSFTSNHKYLHARGGDTYGLSEFGGILWWRFSAYASTTFILLHIKLEINKKNKTIFFKWSFTRNITSHILGSFLQNQYNMTMRKDSVLT